MPFCTRCGKELLPADKFCPNCGQDIRASARTDQPLVPGVVPGARGLGRNTVVHIAKEGLQGLQICSDITLFLAFVIPIPVLAVAYYFLQAGSLALYFTLWIAASGLIYDELRWRGLRSLSRHAPDSPEMGRESWFVPWSAIRMADWNGRTLWFSSTGQAHKTSVTFDKKDAPSVQQSLTASGVRHSLKGPRLPRSLTSFITLTILMFVIAQVILVLAATLPMTAGEQDFYRGVLNSTQSQINGTTFAGEFKVLFLNNIQVALGGAWPFIGAIGFGVASFNTGRVIQIIAIEHGVSPVLILISLYILPHAWVEESAYPIAAVAGMLGVTKWRSVTPEDFMRRRNWGSTKLAIALAGAGLILVVAGFIETLTSYIGILVLALWAPVIAGGYLLLRWYRQMQKPATVPT